MVFKNKIKRLREEKLMMQRQFVAVVSGICMLLIQNEIKIRIWQKF